MPFPWEVYISDVKGFLNECPKLLDIKENNLNGYYPGKYRTRVYYNIKSAVYDTMHNDELDELKIAIKYIDEPLKLKLDTSSIRYVFEAGECPKNIYQGKYEYEEREADYEAAVEIYGEDWGYSDYKSVNIEDRNKIRHLSLDCEGYSVRSEYSILLVDRRIGNRRIVGDTITDEEELRHVDNVFQYQPTLDIDGDILLDPSLYHLFETIQSEVLIFRLLVADPTLRGERWDYFLDLFEKMPNIMITMDLDLCRKIFNKGPKSGNK